MGYFFFSNGFFLSSCLLLIASVAFFQFNKRKTGIILLYPGSFLLGLFLVNLDPFINLWDEQFHALVAKNLIETPLKPILIKEPLFGFSKSTWSYCNIWLHKQPLFLWQIALSMNLFGTNEIAIRLPSVLMHSIMIYFVFRTGKILISDKVGYYSALFFSCSYFPLEYLTGFYATDHNDNAFLFYSFASIWALIEYSSSKNIVFALIVGLSSGAAVMCKWLTGLMVYGLWLIVLFINRKKRFFLNSLKIFSLSLIISISVFLPWQIFASINYPVEYRNSMDFNAKHISEPLEGHDGDVFFYYKAMYEQFGEGLIIPPLVLISFCILIYHLKNDEYRIIVSLTIIVTYLFFSFVETKMYGYVFVTFPFFILGIAHIHHLTLTKFEIRVKSIFLNHIFKFIVTLLIVFLLFDSDKIYKHHSDKERKGSRNIKIKEKKFYLSLKDKIGEGKYILFNCNTSIQSHILGIFYTDYPSFSFILSKDEISKAQRLNYKLVAIDDGKLPNDILENNSILKIKF